jgi:two-component system, sensor histidine kinase YesM
MQGRSLEKRQKIVTKSIRFLQETKLRLQYKLGITFIITFIIPIVVFGFFLLFSFNRILENNLFTYQEAAIGQLMSELDKYFINLHRISRNLSYDIPFTITLATVTDVPQLEQEINKHLQHTIGDDPSIFGYALITDRGKLFASGNVQRSDDSKIFLPSETANALMNEEKSIVLSRAKYDHIADHDAQQVFLFSSSINITYLEQKNIARGILILFIERSFIDAIIQRHNRSANQIFLFDSEGMHIYSNQQEVTFKSLPPDLSSMLTEQKNGRFIIRSLHEKDLVSFTSSRFTTIKLLSFASNNRISNDLFFLSKFTITFLLILVSIFIVFTIHLSHSISSPVNRLQETMDQLEQSNYLDTPILLKKNNRGILSPYFDHLYGFLHTVIGKINLYHQQEKEHELLILQSQINPHFVYNSLNTIRIMAEMEGQEKLARAIRSLIHLLKNSIKIGTIFIPIREEIEQIKAYISLQQLRYDNSFRVAYTIDPSVENFKCIKFILQPLVENAIFHGLNNGSRDGMIEISIRKEEAYIHYVISDNGNGMDHATLESVQHPSAVDTPPGDKIGIQNVRSRLSTYFGIYSTFSIDSTPEKGTTVRYSIPAEPYEYRE